MVPPERGDLVVDVVSDVGAAELRSAGSFAPVARDFFLGHGEIRLVRRNPAAPAEHDAGDLADLRIARDVE